MGGGGSVESSGVRAVQPDRPTRHGSRTPRNRIGEAAVSPEKGRDQPRCTPNGTKVPDRPPPSESEVFSPPVPPFPVAPAETVEDSHQFCSFVSGLYDTCESKPRAKNGDTVWKPREDRMMMCWPP